MNRDIRAAVHEELVADPLIDADDIVVEIFNGEVSLNGTARSAASAGLSLIMISGVTKLLAAAAGARPGTRSARPVRRHAVSSRCWTYRAW